MTQQRTKLMDRVQRVMSQAIEFRSSFDKYAYLWENDRTDFMRQFLLYGHVITSEELEAHLDTAIPENPPTLAQFKAQVRFEDVKKCNI